MYHHHEGHPFYDHLCSLNNRKFTKAHVSKHIADPLADWTRYLWNYLTTRTRRSNIWISLERNLRPEWYNDLYHVYVPVIIKCVCFFLKKTTFCFHFAQSTVDALMIRRWNRGMEGTNLAYQSSSIQRLWILRILKGWVYRWVGSKPPWADQPLPVNPFINLLLWMYTNHHWMPYICNSKAAHWNFVKSHYDLKGPGVVVGGSLFDFF